MGTRTIVDVLETTTVLYNAKQQLSDARYSYLINQLNISYALGPLTEQSLQQLNSQLGKEIPTSPETVAPENAQHTSRVDSGPAATGSSEAARPAARHRSGNPFGN